MSPWKTERAREIPGWMSPVELDWLAEQASRHWMIAEIGSWRGRSTRALAENSPGTVYAIDSWMGSPETANDPDFAAHPPGWLLQDFRRNLADCANVVVVQRSSTEAALELATERFDMVFIDGAHDYHSVKADIRAWSPLLTEGGLLCGHDYKCASWPGVTEAVDELVPGVRRAGDWLWYSTSVLHEARPVTVVVLAKYADIFAGFYASAERYGVNFPKILVRDGRAIADPAGWTVVQGPERFSMAGNGNLGLKLVPPNSDILYCGDDVRFLATGTVEKLRAIAHSVAGIGILSPKLIGRGSEVQVKPGAGLTYCEPDQMWFPCVYLKRELIDKIGYLDEQFTGFGSDDLDYCLRAQAAGYKLAVTGAVTVVHEGVLNGPPTTFARNGVEWRREQAEAREKLRHKHGLASGGKP